MQNRLFQVLLASFVFLALGSLAAQATDVVTLAGNGDPEATNATGAAASFYNPSGGEFDSSGNLYVADTNNNLIRKITPSGVVTTFAGDGTAGFVEGNGTAARLSAPKDIVIDSSDNLFVSEYGTHIIRRIAPSGMTYVFAGKQSTSGATDGVRGAATFNAPSGLAIDNGNNIYVADTANNKIRKITPTGVVTTIAGNGNAGAIDDATATNASFNGPADVVMASTGHLYVTDANNHLIRKIVVGGAVTTHAGNVGVSGVTDDTGTAAEFNSPMSIVADSGDDLYVSDYSSHTIRKVTLAGVVTTPTGTANTSGSTDDTLAGSTYYNPAGLAIMNNGAMLLADFSNNKIRKITTLAAGRGSPSGTPDTLPSGTVATLAGNGDSEAVDATGTAASFYNPSGLDFDSSGNLYVADTNNNLIRKITPAGVVTTFAGDGTGGFAEGNGTAARLHTPKDIVIDSSDNLFVSEYGTHIIRRIEPSGLTHLFAGKQSTSGSADGVRGAATFNAPSGLAIDNGNNIYVADTANNIIRKITPVGVVTTIAGNGTAGDANHATATNATFNGPVDVVMASTGDLYVADANNHLIRKVIIGGAVTTLAGNSGVSGDVDATGTSALFNSPNSITLGNGDRLYVSDYINHLIRKVTLAGVVTTATGSSADSGNDNGPIYRALYNTPAGLAVMANGRVLVADYSNNLVRKITGLATAPGGVSGTPDALPDEVVTTFAGNGDTEAVDATGTAASFYYPQGIDVASNGTIFVADTNNHLIRKISTGGVVTTFAGDGVGGNIDDTGLAARFHTPLDLVIDSSDNIFVSDSGTHVIRKITQQAVVTTFAGTSGVSGSANGTGAAANFNTPAGLGIDASNNIYLADSANHTIRKITSGAVVTTLAGAAGLTGTSNGTGNTARFNVPYDVVVASTGDLYVTDRSNSVIRKVTAAGVVTKLAGTFSDANEVDATGGAAKFTAPAYITVDGDDNLYVTDTTSYTLRKVTLAGVVTTPSGSAAVSRHHDDDAYRAFFVTPGGMTVTSDCDILLADYGSNRIRKITDLASGCSAPAYRRRVIISDLPKKVPTAAQLNALATQFKSNY